MTLTQRPLGISPDGLARWLVRVGFRDAAGRPTALIGGGDIAFTPSRGSAQWQTRARFDAPAAIVTTALDGPLTVAVRAAVGVRLAPVHAATDTRAWHVPRIVAAALGPHEVQIGWFPLARAPFLIWRGAGNGRRALAVLTPPCSTFRDDSVQPGRSYRYDVAIVDRTALRLHVDVPREPAHGRLSDLAGKAMWLSFSPDSRDPDAYTTLDPAAIVARATRAGVSAIELRTTYGEFREITPGARPTIDALLDAAAAARIAVVAWTVPRRALFDDLQAEVEAARHRTPGGHGFAALAPDLERGEYFLGDGPAGYAALAAYPARLRAALGPHYPLLATVEDPYFERLTVRDYPYPAIAAAVDALQPMAYWRMLSAQTVGPAAVRASVQASYAALRQLAGRALPIDVGAQTRADGPGGAPPPGEVSAAVAEARALGALGITFYDWSGTSAAQWHALASTPWLVTRRTRAAAR